MAKISEGIFRAIEVVFLFSTLILVLLAIEGADVGPIVNSLLSIAKPLIVAIILLYLIISIAEGILDG